VSHSELVCWLWHCAATVVALKRHERANAFNLVDLNLSGKSFTTHAAKVTLFSVVSVCFTVSVCLTVCLSTR